MKEVKPETDFCELKFKFAALTASELELKKKEKDTSYYLYLIYKVVIFFPGRDLDYYYYYPVIIQS